MRNAPILIAMNEPTAGALLALIAGDHKSIQVLAAWAALGLPVSAADDDATIRQIAALTELPVGRVQVCMQKIRTARAIDEDGISPMADKLLQSHVAKHVAGKKAR